jgi:predicted metalloprotease
MRWQGRAESSNIEDRRGAGPSMGGFSGGIGPGGGIPIGGRGGLGIGGIIVLLIICWVLGINPLDLLAGGNYDTGTYTGGGSYSQPASGTSTADEDQLVNFVSVVVKDTETYWGDYFESIGRTYQPPKVVLFSQATQSGCGVAQTASGPFYCPNDKQIYLDLAFYQQLRNQFHAAGDFAQAYVIAHEVGHHVQDELGTLAKYDRQMQSADQTTANTISVRIELQADCYAGVWANYEGRQNYLDNGDTQEAMNAANQIGDDTLQREFQGTVQPRTFTHGTSAQRMKWFKTGLDAGNPQVCDTFSGSI